MQVIFTTIEGRIDVFWQSKNVGLKVSCILLVTRKDDCDRFVMPGKPDRNTVQAGTRQA
jgi:hypothetical protein